MIEFDKEIIQKYDKPGPRYTSYPTAPQFSEDFAYEEYINEIKTNNSESDPSELSLYFHIPFCDSLCYFCGCNTVITKNRERVAKYVDYVKREIDMMVPYLNHDRLVTQLHWGGGTPTHLNPDEIIDLKSYINKSFNIAADAEQSCEIDPRELKREHLEALRSTGFNRISMGIQDFNPEVQKAVNRIQSEELSRKVVNWVRELDFESTNLDLIYGLPYQTLEEFEKTIDKIIDINPDRIALFNFAYVPWMKAHMKLIREETLPNPEEKLDILRMSINKLTDNGYEFIGMDHFAKPDDELTIALKEKNLFRNFQGYSTHAGADLYAFGSTSISQFGRIYAQNYKDEQSYYKAIDIGKFPLSKGYKLNSDDEIRRYVIMMIMCNFELDFERVDRILNINSREYFAKGIEKLKPMFDDNLVQMDDKKLLVNEKGRLLIRNIAICFDGYIERKEDNARYSKTV